MHDSLAIKNTEKDVYIHELLLCMGWYEKAIARSSGGHSPEYYLDFLRRLLKRVNKGKNVTRNAF